MPYDALVAQSVVSELRHLIGARVERVLQAGKEEIVLALYGTGGKSHLFFSSNAINARLHLSGNPPASQSASTFTMSLRRHLEGSQLREISLPSLERVVTLHFQSPPIRGDKRHCLVAEIMGRHSNVILVDPASGLIIDGLKRYSHAVSRYREVLPGRAYLPPPPTDKADLMTLDDEKLARILLSGTTERTLEKVLIQNLNGFSPLLAREVAARAGLNPELLMEYCGDHELILIWKALEEIKDIVRNQFFRPTLVIDNHQIVAYAAIELKQYFGLEQVFLPSMNAAIDRYYQEQQTRESWARTKNRLEQLLGEQQKRWLKKAALHQQAVVQAWDAERYRLAGEVITLNIHRIEPGASLLETHNPYNPEEILRLELNPAHSPSQNAQAQFKKYRKVKTQAEQAAIQLSQAQQEIAYWESVGESLDRAETLEDLAEISQELEAPSAKKPVKSKSGRTSPQAPSPLRLDLPQGFIVMIGRNNRQNDYLTTRLARPEDTWLHAKDIPGAHVLVRNQAGQPLPPQVLEQAAGLAAFYSKARLANAVPVDYTLAKYVHKIKGSKPGMVFYTQQKTIMARPGPINSVQPPADTETPGPVSQP